MPPEIRFAELGLPVALVQALRRADLETAFPIQAAVIPDILAGRDVLGRAATGSGKTLAFGLPLLVRVMRGAAAPRRPRGLILTPTRELALQIERALDEPALALGVRLGSAVGGVPIKRQIARLSRGVDVLIATPGRLTDLIDQDAVRLDAVRVAAVDEADHMAALGFLDQVTALLDRVPTDAQHLLFSATLDAAADALADRYLPAPVTHSVDEPPPADAPAVTSPASHPDDRRDPLRHNHEQPDPPTVRHNNAADARASRSDSPATRDGATGSGAAQPELPRRGNLASESPAAAANPVIAHHLLYVRKPDKYKVVAEIAGRAGRTLLFVRTQYGAQKLARRLREVGIAATELHGGKSQNQRNRALSAYAGGAASVLIATDVAARGIHVDDISLVVHVDPPADPKDYQHRTGRTGRAGATGTVVTLVTDADRAEVGALVAALGIAPAELRVRPGDRALTVITGAREPSGRPVPDPAAPPADTPPDRDTPGNRRRRKASAPHHARRRNRSAN
ncbi:DEAD/DEAH box helicase [Nocardia wallacei]|uniref:DEAD/DEAH box helicase n=1 Tax=Nocardia wallacei TaxID=480035 RepID=UPI003CC80228